MRLTGNCRCGQLKLHVEADTLPPLYACHCLDCQRWSGSAFALHMLCGASSVELEGEAAVHAYEHEGHRSTHYACDVCFTRLFNETSAAPGMRVVRAGVLDNAQQFVPLAHIWVARKQPWVELPPGVAQWQGTPTPEEFAHAVMG